MATPTPTLPPNPSSASKRATGTVSTPSHLGFSPAPRSVPSPATTRKEQSGKTPINHPTTSSHGSKTLGGTPMIHNLSQQGNTSGSSPGANMLSFGTPLGLGAEGITPGAFNMATPGMAGVPMGLTMSDLGVNAGAGAPKRNEDEERRTKMRKVLKSIGKPKGRVSEEAINRISRRVGFDVGLDHETAEERVKNASLVGNRTADIAGKKILIDVALKGQRADSVSVTFATESSGLQEQTQAIGMVLLDDLRKAGGETLDASLGRFAGSLERLARIDRLSSDSFDCFEALSGIYTSLRGLYNHESAASNELDVLRRKSGKPMAHADGQIGFSIAYWETDEQPTKEYKHDSRELFKLNLGIERSSVSLYPSARVSEQWLLDSVNLSTTDAEPSIPWQEPPPTLVAPSTGGDAMPVDGEPKKLPDLRFTANLDPPITLPWQLATNVLQTFGVSMPQLLVYPPSWNAMLLDPNTTAPFNAVDGRAITSTRDVLVMRDGGESQTSHSYTLDVAKPDGGYKLKQLPFEHPRQLVELLPTLRQWACFGSLVQSLFAGSNAARDKLSTFDNVTTKRNPPLPFSLDDLLTPPATPPKDEKLAISVSLATTPVPTLSFVFAAGRGKPVCNVAVQVLQNGVLSVLGAEYFAVGGGEGVAGKKLADALEACGDVGVWIEWLRTQVK
ncbi:hypothetical protein LTR17_008377 [Elasticomyces elasticus]|nr:hypothetical protein LTR17_008377 [Elasticomyces elasticus]